MSRFERELSWCVVPFLLKKKNSFLVRHALLGSVKEGNFEPGKWMWTELWSFPGHIIWEDFWKRLLKQTSGVNNTNQTQGETVHLLFHTYFIFYSFFNK